MMKHVRLGFAFVALQIVVVLSGCAAEATRPAHIDPRADQALRRMSAAIGGAQSFAVSATTTMDELLATGQLAEFSRQTRIVVRRPDRLFAEIHTTERAWLLWHAGSDLTILDKKAGTCASARVPEPIDDMLDELAAKYNLTMPLADLLFADPYKVLTADVLTGRFVGTHEVNGVECAQLLFTQENVDWQIWIEADKAPVPRKVVIDYKNLPGRPQFTAMLSDWSLSAAAGDEQFKPVLPKNVTTIEIARMLEEKH